MRALLATMLVALAVAMALAGTEDPGRPQYVFTAAAQYIPDAWMSGGDRFPAGAALWLVAGDVRRHLAANFHTASDPAVSFDGKRVLFSGRISPDIAWQIWEADLAGGAPRQVSSGPTDCIRPLYLPDGRVVYTRLSPEGSFLEAVSPGGEKPLRLTFRPGQYLVDDVLRDGRILFESPAGARQVARDLFAVYPDGSGFESIRCDHGPDRSQARQLASGDLIFSAGPRLARFTSSSSKQLDVGQPNAEVAGPPMEWSPGTWVVSARRKHGAPYGLFLWKQGKMTPLDSHKEMNAVQPVAVRSRVRPREFPSALNLRRSTGKLLCLNATPEMPAGETVTRVRLSARGSDGHPVALGEAAVARDGSFYVEVPADRPIRVEILNSSGKVVRSEQDWIWVRPGEQRVCVGCHAGPERAPENRAAEILRNGAGAERLLGDATAH